MAFDRDLIFAYCQPTNNLFCGSVYCVVGQVGAEPQNSDSWQYPNKEVLLDEASRFIDELDNDGNIDVYLKMLSPSTINTAGLRVYELIKSTLHHQVRRYAYARKIQSPKVHFCGEDGLSLENEQIPTVTEDYAEADVIRALSYINRYQLIETYYKHVYRTCEIEDNHGLITLESFETILKQPYNEDFFLYTSILNGLPQLARDVLHYFPTIHRTSTDKKQVCRETERFLFNRQVLDIPSWWHFIERKDCQTYINSKEFKLDRRRLLWGKQNKKFKDWLLEVNESLPTKYALDIRAAERYLNFKNYR